MRIRVLLHLADLLGLLRGRRRQEGQYGISECTLDAYGFEEIEMEIYLPKPS